MSWIIDVLLIGIVLGTVFFYWKRGFVRSILTFGRLLFSALAASLFGRYVGKLLSDIFFHNFITQKVHDTLLSLVGSNTESFHLDQLLQQDAFVKTVERFGGSMADIEAKFGNMTNATQDTLTELSQTIAAPITTLVTNLLGYLIVFALVYILFFVFTGILSKIFELPVLKQINKLLGLLLGILIAALYALIFCILGSYLLRFIGAISGKFIADELIAGTALFRLIANIKLF